MDILGSTLAILVSCFSLKNCSVSKFRRKVLKKRFCSTIILLRIYYTISTYFKTQICKKNAVICDLFCVEFVYQNHAGTVYFGIKVNICPFPGLKLSVTEFHSNHESSGLHHESSNEHKQSNISSLSYYCRLSDVKTCSSFVSRPWHAASTRQSHKAINDK